MLRFDYSNGKKFANGPAIFLDRDGVINRRRPDDYVRDFSQFEFVPGIRAALKDLSALRLPMILISNQAAIGKGLLDAAGLQEITARMRQTLLEDGTALAAAYYCPHRQDEGCRCRKPQPGLLLQAAADFGIALDRSVFVGDSESDAQAARAAAVSPILFGSGAHSHHGQGKPAAAGRAEDLFDVVVRSLHDAEALRPHRSSVTAPFV